MKRLILCFLICVGISSLSAQATITDTLVANGIQRVYRLYIPAKYYSDNTLRPLIINMHGYTSNATQQQSYTNFMPIADTANFLIVYPQGSFFSGTLNTYWNAKFQPTGINDISFLSNLIDSLIARYRVNPNRVYATGFSNGGFMSHTLACELSQKIAAIASVSGTMNDIQYGINGSQCNPDRPMPIMQIHGDADYTVPYNGGPNLGINMVAVDSIIQFWVRHNQCNSTPIVQNVPDINTFDNCTAIHSIYLGGLAGTTVELFRIAAGGHTWPGSFPINFWEATNQDINASKEIWRFFNSFERNPATLIHEQPFTNAIISIYPNPCNDILCINTDHVTSIAIVNVLGEVLLTQKVSKNSEIDIQHLEHGIYFLKDLTSGKTSKFIKQ